MSAAPPLVRLGIRVRRERAEIALAALLPLLGAGVEEAEPAAEVVEYSLYGPEDELPGDEAVRALAGDALVAVTRAPAPAGWETRWHQHLQTVEVAAGRRRLVVRPPWLEGTGTGGALELVIDPGPTFGAGGHATTRLCLELLLETEPGGGLCDWGAGSGVLAIAAAGLGWEPVAAVEADPRALDAVRANAAANRVAVRAHRLDLTAALPAWAPTVCANLPFDLHAAIAARPLERPPERLLLSGVLVARADATAAAYARHGLRDAARRVRDGWAGLRLERA